MIETCAVCGRPATCHYPPDENPDDATPSCGRAECELQIQAAMDYQDEVGNR